MITIRKAAIFDLDGTLADSMWVWENLLIDFLKAKDITPPAHMLNEVTHMSITQSSAYVQKYFNLPMTPDEVLKEWKKMVYTAYAEKIALKPGAKEYLASLKKRGVLLGIATSCEHTLCETCLQRHGILQLFDTLTYSDEVGKGKNHPDIYSECLRRLNCSPKDATLFEDILVAVRTGKTLGMQVVAVQDQSAKPDWTLLHKEADFFIEDFTDEILVI